MSLPESPYIYGKDDLIVPVILCGGFGRRLWPLSRPYWPKPFLNFGATESLLQETVRRFSGPNFHAPIIICNEEHRFGVATQLHEIGVIPQAIILESKSAGTTAATLFACQYLFQNGYQGNVIVSPADHHVDSTEDFQHVVLEACKVTLEHEIVLLGISPTRAADDFGYISIYPKHETDLTFTHKVESFIEKPSINDAQHLIETGRSFWNSGVFIFDLALFMDLAETLVPDTNNDAALAVSNANINIDFIRLDAESVEQIKCPSFDVAIAESATNVGMVEFNGNWRDMGTWQSVWDSSQKDKDGNVLLGNSIANATTNSIVMSDGINIGVGNMDGIEIIASGNHVTVSMLNDPMMSSHLADIQSQDSNAESTLTPTKLHRVWGTFEIIRTEPNFQIKKLTIKPGLRLSLQRHQHRSEHWIVLSGCATVTIGEKTEALLPSQSTFVPQGTLHRLANNSSEPLIIIEIQTGNYLGEDDIERIEDDYNRA